MTHWKEINDTLSSSFRLSNLTYTNSTCSLAEWTSAQLIAKLVALIVLTIAIICGNGLVIVAVRTSVKLRTVTNQFIVSLAMADILVGVLVLPFSTSSEVNGTWLYGEGLCKTWLAGDVLTCTSSIMHLCGISFDRYVAITKPVMYQSIMTPRLAKIVIVGIWTLSLCIAVPAVIDWDRTMRSGITFYYEQFNDTTICVITECKLTSLKGYVIFSSLGSFFVPCLVMLFFYWRIYKAALATIRSIDKGFKTINQESFKQHGTSNGTAERMALRIHRGRGSSTYGTKTSYDSSKRNSETTFVEANSRSQSEQQLPQGSPYLYPPKISVRRNLSNPIYTDIKDTADKELASSTNKLLKSLPPSPNHSPLPSVFRRPPSPLANYTNDKETERQLRLGVNKLNLKVHAKRFHGEAKATKTLAIIVGVFVMCWLPFFTLYLIRGLCEQSCINETLFTVFFWLGYCNSAVNPCVYACFSADFRSAFQRLLRTTKWCRKNNSNSVVISF